MPSSSSPPFSPGTPDGSYSGFTRILCNPLLNTDSYKASHYLQYPPNTTAMFSYIESRGGRYDRTVFFGLQMLLKEYLCRPITAAMIAEAKDFFLAHGEPFNEAGWRHVLEKHGGWLPVRIRAVAEGTVVPTHQVLMTVECEDPQVFWLASYLETLLLRIWYPITVATQSWHLRARIAHYLEKTSDDPAQGCFKLHDFGARGVSSSESAAIGGAAHLVSFSGTDTVLGVLAARHYYHEPMAAYAVPAAEHSTITAWGHEHEEDAYRNMITQFSKPGAIVSVVSDSYDLFAALELWGGPLKAAVIAAGGTLVVRPDSGNTREIALETVRRLDTHFGSTRNGKGYRVLNHVRVIQGDGITPASLEEILAMLEHTGYAADNITFGMGGALLQQMNRDTLRFAMKCSAIRQGERWVEVFKNPVTDSGKRSKKGRLTLLRHRASGEYRTVALPVHWGNTLPEAEWEEALCPVYENGRLLIDHRFAEIRERAQAALPQIAFASS